MLLILLRNPQKLIAKEELLNAVWGDAAVTENSLTRSIALLRRVLGDEARVIRDSSLPFPPLAIGSFAQ